MGEEALAIAERSGQPFTTAIAHQRVGASLRRSAAAGRGAGARRLRGARTAGARRSMGARERARRTRRDPPAGRPPGGCRGRPARGRRALPGPEGAIAGVLDDRRARAHARRPRGPGGRPRDPRRSAGPIGRGGAGQRDRAPRGRIRRRGRRGRPRGRARQGAGRDRGARTALAGCPNPYAAQVWWTGSLFGPAEAGGGEAVEEARETLERNGWRQALREPELVPLNG